MHINEGQWILGPLQYNWMRKSEKEGKKRGSTVKTVKIRIVGPDNKFHYIKF